MFILVNHDFNETMVKMTDNNLKSVNFCKENFESKLLRDTEDFYLHQMISYDETKSIITYLNQVSYTRKLNNYLSLVSYIFNR